MRLPLLFASLTAASLAGCASTIELNQAPAQPGLSLKDARPPAERVLAYESIRVPVTYFGDADFNTAPLGQFSSLLSVKLPPGRYDLEVNHFRVIDIYPARLRVATSAAVAGALNAMGYASYLPAGSASTEDKVACLVGGTLQGKAITASVQVPYHASPSAGAVKNDPAFRAAVNQCLDRLAAQVAAKPGV